MSGKGAFFEDNLLKQTRRNFENAPSESEFSERHKARPKDARAAAKHAGIDSGIRKWDTAMNVGRGMKVNGSGEKCETVTSTMNTMINTCKEMDGNMMAGACPNVLTIA